jgi:uncharacterized protein
VSGPEHATGQPPAPDPEIAGAGEDASPLPGPTAEPPIPPPPAPPAATDAGVPLPPRPPSGPPAAAPPPPTEPPAPDPPATARPPRPPTGPPAAAPPPPTEPPRAEPPSTGPPADAPPRPHLDDRERSLDPRILQVWRVFAAVRLVPLLLIGTVTGVLTIDGWGWLIGLGLLGLLALSLLWYQPARYARWRWRLTDLALELRRGVVIHQQETVPYFRIQQIDVIQGPVDRLLGLAALQVTTASASGSVGLPGIPAADAPAVRAELLARAAEAVREHPGEVADAV